MCTISNPAFPKLYKILSSCYYRILLDVILNCCLLWERPRFSPNSLISPSFLVIEIPYPFGWACVYQKKQKQKNYISQLGVQLGMTVWLSSSQWDINNFQVPSSGKGWLLCFPSPLLARMQMWWPESEWLSWAVVEQQEKRNLSPWWVSEATPWVLDATSTLVLHKRETSFCFIEAPVTLCCGFFQ